MNWPTQLNNHSLSLLISNNQKSVLCFLTILHLLHWVLTKRLNPKQISKPVNKSWNLEEWPACGWLMMMGFSWQGSTLNISSGVGLKGHPSFCGDRKTNRLTLSCEWLSYIYLIIIELLGTRHPITSCHIASIFTQPWYTGSDMTTTDERLLTMCLES